MFLEYLQKINSNYSGQLSHVPSQPAVVPSPRAMSSRDQSLRSDTWNLSGTQGNVFLAVHEKQSIHHRHLIKEFFTLRVKGIPVQTSAGRLVAKGEEQIGSTVPMPSFARRPSTMNSFSPAEIPQNSMADQQRLYISELHFDKFPTQSTFSCWKIKFKNQVSACFGFPSGAMLWIKEVEMVDPVDD